MNEYLDNLGMEIVSSSVEHIPDDEINNDVMWERIQRDYHESNTLLKDGEPVALAGYQRINNDTAEVWSQLIDETYAKTFFKCVKHYVENVYSEKFVRLQSLVDAEDSQSRKWDERLGFEQEARLKKFEGDHDAIIYRRLS